ncbi:effector-associated constant component EACC1 [Goodfellowiella coeruleoviolacea]|uniref:Uncharacterized protein n=1 Tax=Goodfellowiella coeruleoviolacea TaxID=334858 RepID=A0AAE3KJI1_9PSEU|nr:hypothetical protein [Goodfellowiella coeruleoviolacea]MCP2169655.1 hypothetical protein [Goodfellowiella coeruleoviolacea]
MREAILRLAADNAGPARLHQLTTGLYQDLRALGLVKVARADQAAPEDAKTGTAGSITELVITGVFSAGTLAAVAQVITAYIERTKTRTVTWVEGERTVTFDGISAKDQHRLVEALAASTSGALAAATPAAPGAGDGDDEPDQAAARPAGGGT